MPTSSANKFNYLFVCVFQVALIGIEYNSFFGVVLSHHFQCNTWNGRLEVCLFSVNHYPNVQLFSNLKRKINFWTNVSNRFILHIIIPSQYYSIFWSCYGTFLLLCDQFGMSNDAFVQFLDQEHGKCHWVDNLR